MRIENTISEIPQVLLPIVHRELIVRSRSRATYYYRVGAAAALMVIGGTLFWRMGSVMATGGLILNIASVFLFLFCAVEGLRHSAGCISGERQEGTLGLLFLTHLSSLDVLLGKLAAAGLGSLYALLAMMPLISGYNLPTV